MLVGQQLGPFFIDKELGAGAMGAVYRGKYLKTGQLVAVKVMAPGIGSTNAAASSRFEREANILKQLNHRNIVRLFGVGKAKGVRYYAMEYIKGESLDKVMARRGRMTWEEVIDLGLQLCAALQHAHEAGIVHRDLKPSNLMILEDGTLKLTDFGIAKDLDVTQLTGLNCTVGTAAYMSPEQCRGEKDLTYKSDLYSLGVLFYELITGKKPFITDNSMEMFMHHVNTMAERPSRLALDIPVWLDNLICQLLEKKTEHRPVDAAMVSRVLSTIQEKVEAQHSAGVDAVTARRGDRPRGERLSITEEEREAARSLRPKRRKKAGKKPIQKQVWLQAAGLVAGLALVVGAIVWFSRPPAADDLYVQVDRLMKSDDPDKHEKAREGPIRTYLNHHGDKDDEKTRQVRRWKEECETDRYEKLIDKHLWHQREKKGWPVAAQTDSEKDEFQAADAEADGDADKAAKLWRAVLKREESAGVVALAKMHLGMLGAIPEEFKSFDNLRARARIDRTEKALEGHRQSAFLAYRQELLGDRRGAKDSYDRLYAEALKDPAQRYWQLLAAVSRRELKLSLDKNKQDDKARIDLIRKAVDDAEAAMKRPDASLLDLRLLGQEVILIYGGDVDFEAAVNKAKQIVEEIDARFRDASKRGG